jgi:hypothetical protein
MIFAVLETGTAIRRVQVLRQCACVVARHLVHVPALGRAALSFPIQEGDQTRVQGDSLASSLLVYEIAVCLCSLATKSDHARADYLSIRILSIYISHAHRMYLGLLAVCCFPFLLLVFPPCVCVPQARRLRFACSAPAMCFVGWVRSM